MKALLIFVVGVGSVALLEGIATWNPESLLKSLVYLLFTAIGSSFKINLPGVRSTLSVNFFFVLIAVTQLSLAETLAIGVSGFLVQYLWKPKSKPKLAQVAFNLGAGAIAASLTWRVFHWAWLRSHGVEFPLLMAAAACVYFVINTAPIAIIIGFTENKSPLKIWKESYFWVFPYYLLGAGLAALLHWASAQVGWQVAVLGLPCLAFIYRSYQEYLEKLEKDRLHAEAQRQHAESMSDLHLRTIEALALAIEAKDQTTHDHLQRVQIYALEIGKEMGLSEMEIEALRAASLLHDIGKLAVPEHIISKPGRLTPEEFEKMKIHPTVGAEILEHVRFPYPVVPIVRAHHEKWNGTGYPAGLREYEIPTGARILAAVDCFDALASDRQYRRALPLPEALAYVVGEAGKSFDPVVVEILARRFEELERKATATKPEERPKLSTDIRIERGDAPAAGFEQSDGAAALTESGTRPAEFLHRIGAARQEAQILFELTGDMGRSLSLDATLSILATGLAKLIPFGGLAVYLKRGEVVKCEFATGQDAKLFASLEIPYGQGLSGWVAEKGKPIINGNPAVEPGYLNDPARFTLMRSALAVPLEATHGTIGVLALYDSNKDVYSRDHLRVLQAISSKLGVSIENALRYQHAEDVAVLDFLTELPNARALFIHLQEQVQQCRESLEPLTVLVGDLDGFKLVNDRLGHLEGNRLLQVLAVALKRQCRTGDYVARMGGDEFAIILRGVRAQDAPAAADRFMRAVSETAERDAGFRHVSLSLGAATLLEDGNEPEELLAKADQRMYKMKIERKLAVSSVAQLAAAVEDNAGDARPPRQIVH